MTKRILLLGKNGQVGWELQRALAPLGCLIMHDRGTCDLANENALTSVIDASAPDVIVNAAAYTAVDRAETEKDAAYQINSKAVALMAKKAAARGALLVHYSTDYVFDGSNQHPYNESDATNPLSIYGDSKRQGELAIVESGCRHLIFRTSWVFATRGVNFAKTMLRLAASEDTLRVVADQWGAPTSAALIADVTAHALHSSQSAPSGIYHLAAGGETNWHEYAKFVIERAAHMGMAVKVSAIDPITTANYPTPAKRPMNSRLNCAKLQAVLNLTLPHWQHHVEHTLTELTGQ